jgi:aminoglycoside phosphotransferase (APT) family kinase protein
MDHRALIAERFPQLAGLPVEAVGDGWTCDTYEVDGTWIVQVPRSDHAADRLRAQATLLPDLIGEVSAPIPDLELLSLEEDPPMVGYRRIDGVACDAAPDGTWPERLGRFLYDLHSVPPEFVGLRALTAAQVRARLLEEWSALAALVLPELPAQDRADAEAMLRAATDEDLWTFAPCLTHGDLGPEHVLVTPAGDLAGVLDWEEASVGDPAWDFAWWVHAMPARSERILGAYGGPPDRRFRDRARILFAIMPWHEIEHGLRTGQGAFVRRGVEGAHERLPRTG